MRKRPVTTTSGQAISRRKFLYNAAVVAAAAACAPAAAPTSSPAGGAPAQLQGTKIALLHWTSFVPEEDKWIKETLVNEWAKPNGVDLSIELVAANQLQPKVLAALTAGGGPDVMLLQWTWPHLYADRLTDVSSIADKAGAEGGGWYEASRQNCQAQGTWRAVPFGLLGNAVAYRESILKSAGGTSTFPATWEEWAKVGADVKAKTKLFTGQAIAHSFGDPPTFAFPFLWSYGGSETDETGKKMAINSSATKDALVAFKDWFGKVADPQCLSWDDSSNNRAYAAKQIWATNNGASIYVAALKDDAELAKDTQHALLPKGPKGQFLLAVPFGLAIPKYVKDPAPARELISYMTSTKAYASFMQAGKGYTQAPYKKGEGEMWPSTDPKYEPFRKIGNLTKWYGYPASPSPAATDSGSKYIVVDMLAKVAQGETPEAAMSWAEGELKKVYRL